MGLAVLAGGGFDHVRVDGALGEKIDAFDLGGLFIEYIDKGVADDLALRFGVVFALEPGEKTLFSINADHFHTHVASEGFHHLVAFILAQQTVINEHAGQLITNGLVQECRYHRGVNATGETKKYVAVTYLVTHSGNLVFDDLGRGPQFLGTADLHHEVFENALALQGVGHFGVELHTVEALLGAAHGSNGAARRGGGHVESVWHTGDFVAVAHPHIEQRLAVMVDVVLDVAEQLIVAINLDLGVAKLLLVGALYRTTQLHGHGLHAVANTQHRQSQLEHALWCTRRP